METALARRQLLQVAVGHGRRPVVRKGGLMQGTAAKGASLNKRLVGVVGTIFMGLILLNGFLVQKVDSLTEQYEALKQEVSESREANERVLSMLVEIRDEQEKQSQELQKAMQVTANKRLCKGNVMLLKAEGYSSYTDLGAHSTISVEDMDRIIDYYASHARHSTTFQGHGWAFIEAAKQTGLNPIYLFAHAACESDFGCSNIARGRHNYYGINAVDSNPSAAYAMGDGIDEGIISGANWIKHNYYDQGYTTLESMHNAGYATDPNWAEQITAIANTAIRVI